jgi:2-dehydro-3-deoxyphosphogluconate aldolase/(4S)-4-hydroxy-2-oxoglutarate aldolase
MFNLRKFRIIPSVKVDTYEEALMVAEALVEGGLPVMELMFRRHSDSKAIRSISQKFPDFLIGVGNILSRDQLLRAIDAGAAFAFAPGVNVETIKEAGKRNIMFAPGVCSPSDLENSLLHGSVDFQFYPAEPCGGIEMLKAIIDPFQHLGIEIFARGGITKEKVKDYLAIPQVAAISAAWIAPSEVIQSKNWRAITDEARNSLELNR